LNAQTPAAGGALDKVTGALKDFATHSATVDAQLKQGNVQGALETALNSPGDSITLTIGADGSVGAGGNVGVNGGVEVTVTKTETGYEMSVKGEAGVTVGGELAQGTEANVGVGASVSPTFSFNSLSEVAQGTAAMAGLAAQAAPGTSLMTTIVDQVAGPVAGVSNWLGDQFQNASDLPVVGGVANAVGNFFHGIGGGAQAVDNATGAEAAQFLQQHLKSITVSGNAAAEVSANLGIPGVEVEGFGLDASLAAKGETSLTIEFGNPPKVSVDRSYSLEAEMSGGLGIAGSAQGSASVNFHNEYTLNPDFDIGKALKGEKQQGLITPGEATVSFEIESSGDVGGAIPGVSAGVGGGGKVTFTVNQADVTNGLGSSVLQSFAQGNLSPLLNHLGNVPITATSEIYGTANTELEVGASVLGNGLSIQGGASWQDVLLTSDPVTFTGNQLLQSAQNGVLTAADYLQRNARYLVD
jgi:hypothetical protein